ncbi:MAG TPA: uroporphyrinogen-III synthase [Blastocatellia bacterium]|nr:uroporphyrinogen-III synthase [Blastocatellia bacterium]
MTSRKLDKSKAAANPKRRRPLAGKTVLVTRPLTQSSGITRLLEQGGASVVHCAAIEIIPPSSWEAIDRAIRKIESYDWLVFTSANGPQFFFDRFAEVPARVFQPPIHQSICAIGPATAKAIEAAGTRVDLVVRESTAEGVLREIIERVGSQVAIRGLRFLLPGARQARDFLPVELRRLGAQVDAVEAYQTVKPNVDIGSLFELHKISVITFTSPSTVLNFAKLVGADLLAVLRKNTLVACIGPVTAAAAVEQKFKRIVQAESATTEALVEAIARSVANERFTPSE